MSNIIDVKKTVVKFLKENIKCHHITVVKIQKIQENWNAVAEIYEDDSFLKSMNLPMKQIRMFYWVKMDEKLDIIFFERMNSMEDIDLIDE